MGLLPYVPGSENFCSSLVDFLFTRLYNGFI